MNRKYLLLLDFLISSFFGFLWIFFPEKLMNIEYKVNNDLDYNVNITKSIGLIFIYSSLVPLFAYTSLNLNNYKNIFYFRLVFLLLLFLGLKFNKSLYFYYLNEVKNIKIFLILSCIVPIIYLSMENIKN